MAITGGYTNTYTDLNNLTDYTFLNVDIGTAATDRFVSVALFNNSDSVPSALTINAVSATQKAAAVNRCSIWGAVVPTDASVTVEVTGSGLSGHMRISVYAHYGVNPAALDTASSSADPAALNIDAVIGGLVIAAATDSDGSSLIWDGVSQDHGSSTGETYSTSVASRLTTADETPRTVSGNYSNPDIARACAVSFRSTVGEGVSSGTVSATAVSAASKLATGASEATVSVTAVGAPTFKAVGAAVGTAAVDGKQGYLGVAAGTASVAAVGHATKKSVGEVTTASALDAVSNATKKSPGAITGSVAPLGVSNATKLAIGTVSASDTVAAVTSISAPTKKAVAVVSENGSTVLAISSYKRGIRRAASLVTVTTPSTVTLHDLPAPVALSIQ